MEAGELAVRGAGAAIPAIVTLSLAVSCTAVVLMTVDRLLLRPLPVADTGRIVFLSGITEHPAVDAVSWWSRNQGLEAIAEYRSGTVAVQFGDEEEWIQASFVSPEFFRIVGGVTSRGRVLTDEDVKLRSRVVVVSHDYALNRMGTAEVVGKDLRINGESHRIVGVLRNGFAFPGRNDLWLVRPAGPNQAVELARRMMDGQNQLLVPASGWVGLLRQGVSAAQASQELTSMLRVLDAESARYGTRAGELLFVRPFLEVYGRAERRPLEMLLLGGVLLFAGAIVSTSTVLFGVALRRRKEYAIRESLGATPGQIVRQAARQALSAGLLCGGLTAPLTLICSLLLKRLGSAHLRPGEVLGLESNWVALASLVAGCIAAGLVWVFSYSCIRRSRPNEVLYGRQDGTRLSQRTRRVLLVGQVSIAFALCLSAVTALQSYSALSGVAKGDSVRPDGLLWMRLRVSSGEHRQAIREQVVQAAEGVQAGSVVALADHVWWLSPGAGRFKAVTFQGRQGMCLCTKVAGRYFETLGLRLTGGGGFQAGGEWQVVVDETFATRLGRGNVLGQPLLEDGEERSATIVGVVPHVSSIGGERSGEAQCYFTFGGGTGEEQEATALELLVHPRIRANGVAAALRRGVGEVPGASVGAMIAVEDELGRALAPLRLQALFLGLFAICGGLLAVVGLHGTLALVFATRQREMAIRLAVGAGPGDIAREVCWEGVRLTLGGVGLGAALSICLGTVLANWMFQMRVPDAASGLMVVAVFLSVAVLAAMPVIGRILRLEPARILSAE